jgi:alpha-beta hydrolase superfamily lysophospholipase
VKEEFYFDSRDGEHKLHAVKWVPETETPVLILQIIHGMAEHIERYDDFAQYLAKKGILVVGDDHLGHGRSVKPGEPYGYFCKNDAPTVLVRDEHRLKKMMQEQYVGVPYIILGHSMGSFILRNYLLRYGSGIDGAIIMGTGMPSKASITVALTTAAVQKVIFGEKHVSKLMQRGTYRSYLKRIKNPATSNDWLSSDAEYVGRRQEDKLSGFTFTVNGFQTLYRLIRNLYDKEKLKTMPQELPVLFVSGAEDPVGVYGEAVTKVYESYKEIGMEHVQLKLYAGDRHEILNEKDRKDIYGDIYRWLLQRV